MGSKNEKRDITLDEMMKEERGRKSSLVRLDEKEKIRQELLRY